MIELSKTSKLDGVRSWSLQAGKHCPGSHNASVCNGCYAKTGFYSFAPAINKRAFNADDWQREDWVSDMVQALQNERFFRWFDSGDIYKLKLAEKMLEVCKLTPWVSHWIPTQTWDIKAYQSILKALDSLPNVVLRASAKDLEKPVTGWKNSSVIVSTIENAQKIGAKICHSATNQGKCGSCRDCYSKEVPIIAYLAHGAKMKKHILISEGKA